MHIGRQQENILCVGNILQNRERKTLPLCICQDSTNLPFTLANFHCAFGIFESGDCKAQNTDYIHEFQICRQNTNMAERCAVSQDDKKSHNSLA